VAYSRQQNVKMKLE